ncbi:MAG: protein kinase [Candidatus Sulfotelmatobacter sp.]
MPLAPGTKLGSYEIIAPIGAGGMGEVYRARDMKLARFVAIKILPKAFSSDTEYRQRLEREARVLAAINHPNILSIHDTAAEGDVHYLVCELLEGMTLRYRLQEGPVAIRKCVEIAIQIANGLAAAHEKGIIHRDLKPENIFLLKDGRVKILDFGLAKQAASNEDGNTLSFAEPRTQDGLPLGTVGYMSPEQVRGRPADVRSDIFSLGVVLYEMLAGRHTFAGDSSVEVMNATLKEDPPDLAASGRNVPKGLSSLTNRCLEKNPDERIQSARDLAFALEAAESGSVPAAVPVPSSHRGRTRVLAYVALGMLLIVSYFAGRHFRPAVTQAAPSFRRLTFRPGTILAARFAPDGRTIVYGAKLDGQSSRIYVTSSDSPESRALDADDVSLLGISDSGELAVVRGCRHEAMLVDCHGTLARMPLSGGAPRDIMNGVQAADWVPKTDELAAAHEVGGISRVEFPIGNIVYETSGWISSIRVSPDGSEIGIVENPTPGSDTGDVLVVGGHGERKAQADGFVSVEGLSWSPSGKQVWFVANPSGEGWANELHFLDGSGQGGLMRRFQGTTRLHDIFRDGRMLITREDWRISLDFREIKDTLDKDLSWFDGSEIENLAPDGSEVLFIETGEAPRISDLYLRKTDGSAAIRLGEGDWADRSPDGRWVIASDASDRELFLIPTGVGNLESIPASDFIKTYGAVGFLPDGRHIVFAASDGQHWRMYTQDLNGGKPVAFSPEVGQGGPQSFKLVSPDGKFVWNRDQQNRLTIYPLDGSAPRLVPGLSPGDIPANWASDSNHVYVYQDEFPLIVSRLDLMTGKKAPVAQFNPRDPVGLEGVRAVRMTPDGRFGAYSYIRALSELYLVRDFSVQ